VAAGAVSTSIHRIVIRGKRIQIHNQKGKSHHKINFALTISLSLSLFLSETILQT